jgi:hypothetical protein
MGLFAYKTFPKNSKGSGKIVPASEAKDSQYAVGWSNGKVVNAKRHKTVWEGTRTLVEVLTSVVKSVKETM